MKNTLTDLNNHLFAQIERLSDEDLSDDKIEIEIKRGAAIVAAADQILRHATLHVQAAKIMSDMGADPTKHLKALGAPESPVLSLVVTKQ